MTGYHVIHREQRAGLVLKVVPDPDPLDPRVACDNAATMACQHPRYRFGDRDGIGDLRRAIERSPYYRRTWEALDIIALIVTGLPHCADIVALPLSIYDHGGVTMWAGPPRYTFDPGGWDTSPVGFIFMTKAEVLANWGLPGGASLTARRREQALALMRAEVESYDAWLTGQVCGYVVEDATGETLDSCWGYFAEGEALDEGRKALDWYVANMGVATPAEPAIPD